MEHINAIHSMARDWAPPIRTGETPDTEALARGSSRCQSPASGCAEPAVPREFEALYASLNQLATALGSIAAASEALRAEVESMLGELGASGNAAATAAAAVELRGQVRQKASFEFVTQEGDIVKLALRSRTRIDAAGVAVTADGNMASAAEVRTVTSSRLVIDVQGHLNQAELAAITDAMQKMEQLADDFFAGDIDAAVAASAHTPIDSEQLASVAVQLRSTMRWNGSATYVALPAPEPTPTPVSAPASLAAVDPRVTAESVTAAEAVPAVASDQSPVADPMPKGNTPAVTSAAPTLAELVRSIIDRLHEAGIVSVQEASLAQRMRLQWLIHG